MRRYLHYGKFTQRKPLGQQHVVLAAQHPSKEQRSLHRARRATIDRRRFDASWRWVWLHSGTTSRGNGCGTIEQLHAWIGGRYECFPTRRRGRKWATIGAQHRSGDELRPLRTRGCTKVVHDGCPITNHKTSIHKTMT